MDVNHNYEHITWAANVTRYTNDFDRFTEGWQKVYTAAKGCIFCECHCSGCCSLAVNCTFPEAFLIAGLLTTDHAADLHDHVKHLLRVANSTATFPDWLRAHRTEAGSCHFLDPTGACSIYTIRPLSCRALLSTMEPRWCNIDFKSLSSMEKQAFMASLDRSIVSFPMQYVAATKEYAEVLERKLLRAMAESGGCALYGSLPILVWLEREFQLSAAVNCGRTACEQLLAAAGVHSPFLVTFIEQKYE